MLIPVSIKRNKAGIRVPCPKSLVPRERYTWVVGPGSWDSFTDAVRISDEAQG